MIKKIITSLIILFSLVLVQPALAEETKTPTKSTAPSLSSQLDAVGKAGFGQDATTASTRVNPVITGVLNIVLGFVGTVAFVIFLVGGFLWLSARGNDSQVTKAKQYMFNGTVGVIIIILAYSLSFYITEVVFKAATGS